MSDLKRYYDEEMRYLLGAGREFAREHPDAGNALSIAETEDRDPLVERLFENFAFLTARVRQTLDTQDDAMAGQLLDQAAPGLDHPLPAVSVVEFVPSPDTSETGAVVQRGAEIRSPHLSGLKRPVRFRTTRDCRLQPLRIDDFRLSIGSDGQSSLDLSISAIDSAGLARWPERLDIFLGGEQATAWTLRHWLLRKTRRIEHDGIRSAELRIVPTEESHGYSADGSESSRPMQDLRDFFCADDRFRFVSLVGLSEAVAAGSRSARIRIQFDQTLPRALEQGIAPSLPRLNCVPATNCFPEACQPHLLDPSRTEYPLLAADGNELEVLETDTFQGASQSDPTKVHVYQRFSGWRHSSRKAPENGWYRIVRRPNRSGGMKTAIVVGHPDPDFAFADEYLGGVIWCCDGDQPVEILRPGDLREPAEGVPSGLAVRSLTRPSQVYRPPGTHDFRWKLLAHFQRSFRDLCRLKPLQETLRILLWDPREFKKPCIEKMSSVEVSTGYELVDATPCPIAKVTVTISDDSIAPDAWDRIGALDAFAALLFRLLDGRRPTGTRTTLALRIQPLGIVLAHGEVAT